MTEAVVASSGPVWLDAAGQRRWAEGLAFAPLPSQRVVAVAGPDRLKWLDALTTKRLSDVSARRGLRGTEVQPGAGLAPGESREALILDPQGHLQFGLAVVDQDDQTWLVTDGAAEVLAAYLESMRFRYQVSVQVVPALVIAVPGPGPAAAAIAAAGALATWDDPWPGPVEGAPCYGPKGPVHPGAGWRLRLVVLLGEHWPEVVQAAAAAGATQVDAAGVLEANRIAAWRPRAGAEAADGRTLPHELDLLRTAVTPNSGCYRGQEAVAKVLNLGRPPRRLVFLDLDGSQTVLPQPGAAVFMAGAGPEAEPLGHVTAVAVHLEQGPIALALVKRTLDPVAALRVAVPAATGGLVAAAQTEIVPASGEPDSRLAPRRRAGHLGPVPG
ncbi:MAG: hypothetical protein LBR19_06905 [Bifidobacteriaceae bacterium]|nr:hypothetical protein [Bifidobacteriaceae bacterium]